MPPRTQKCALRGFRFRGRCRSCYYWRALNKAVLSKIYPWTLKRSIDKAAPIKWEKFKKYYHRSCRLITIPDASAVSQKCDELTLSASTNERLMAMAAAMAFWLGLRKSEIYKLETERVRFIGEDEDYIEVLGKGGKYRRAPLKLLPVRYLKLLKTFFEDAVFKNSRYIFTPSDEGKYNYLFRKNFARTMIAPSGMHSLRHAFATTHTAEGSMHPVMLSAILGHESLQVTHSVYDQSSRELLRKSQNHKIIKETKVGANMVYKAMGITPAGLYKKIGKHGLISAGLPVKNTARKRGRPCEQYFPYDAVIDIFCREGVRKTNKITPQKRGACLWHAYYRRRPRRKSPAAKRPKSANASQ